MIFFFVLVQVTLIAESCHEVSALWVHRFALV